MYGGRVEISLIFLIVILLCNFAANFEILLSTGKQLLAFCKNESKASITTVSKQVTWCFGQEPMVLG